MEPGFAYTQGSAASRRCTLPVFDPAVRHVGEFEGTPLYAEVATTAPHNELYIPLENDYWQMLVPGGSPGAQDTVMTRPAGVEGVDPTGDPTDTNR